MPIVRDDKASNYPSNAVTAYPVVQRDPHSQRAAALAICPNIRGPPAPGRANIFFGRGFDLEILRAQIFNPNATILLVHVHGSCLQNQSLTIDNRARNGIGNSSRALINGSIEPTRTLCLYLSPIGGKSFPRRRERGS